MYVVKFALLFILVVIPVPVLSISCVLTETLQNLSTFCHFRFEGGSGRGVVKKETMGIKFFIRHQHFDVSPNKMLFVWF